MTTQERLRENEWRTADGVVMLISDMTDSHLANSIKMLERNLAERPDDYGADPDDGDGAYWAKISEERHNEEIANALEKQISILQAEQVRRTTLRGEK